MRAPSGEAVRKARLTSPPALRARSHPRSTTLRNIDYYFWGWSADYPDPENFLDLKFHSGSRQNDTQYSNPEVDAILDQARTEADPTRRLALYDQAEEMIVNDAPWIPLFHGASHNIVKPYVKGWLETPLVVPRLRFVSIER